MATYIIKPEFIDYYGPDANSMTVLTDSDIERLASDWEMDVDAVKEQLIEQKPTVRTPIHRFSGNPADWQQLNRWIEFDSGVTEPYCESEADYIQAVRDGFITFDGYYTTIWED